uniref:Uncharacterized protein n=1 Tax=Tetranychus urticae TaxID=32264 RepID=T1KN57_TETUR
MAGQNSNSDNITFKVKHLNAYHGIVIDLNDARYESKHRHQQIFEQLESITGVPSRYTTGVIILRNMNPSDVNNAFRDFTYFHNQKAFVPDSLMKYSARNDITSLNIRDDERFHLQYKLSYAHYISKRLSISYYLIEERDVLEVGCGPHFCQSKCTESYFKRLKDLVNNDEMNAKITQLVQPLEESQMYSEADKIYREFNVEQFFHPVCFVHEQRRSETGHAYQRDRYLRTRG